MKGLEDSVQRKIDSEIKKMFTEMGAAHFPYDDNSTLEEIGLENMDAVDFLSRLEDTFKCNFDEIVDPLYQRAQEKARKEAEDEKEYSLFAPLTPYQEMFVRIRDIRNYIIQELQAKEPSKENAA